MRLGLAVSFVLCFFQAVFGAEAVQLTVLPGTVRVRPEGAVGGSDVAEVFCARGEVESFQVVVTAVGKNLNAVRAKMSPLIGADKAVLPAANVKIFREVFIPVRYSSPRATLPPGLTADPLVPLTDLYTGKEIRQPRWSGRTLEGARFGGSGFDVWQGRHQPLWVDVEVPADAAAGLYEGTFTVRTANAGSAAIGVRVTVWDFVLPPGPTHENHFGGFSYMGRYHRLDRNSQEYYQLEDRYIAMMAAHRINPPLPYRLRPRVGEDGAAIFDQETDKRITAFVERYHVTNIDVPRAGFADITGKGRAKALRYYQSWYAYLKKKGWAERAYLYMLDEPNDKEAYERVRQLGALVHEAAPQLRRLVVEQPYSQNQQWGSIDDAVDIWCPLFGFIHEPGIKRARAAGDDVWSYTALCQKAPSYHPEYEKVKNDDPPYWQIDFDVTNYRIAPWLNRRYGVTGLLYWTTVCWSSPQRNPWDDPGFRVRFNGEGSLFYPGKDAGIDGPVASIRLKNLRDGMEDYEYFVLLQQRAGRQAVDEIVREAVPTWGTWDRNPYRLLELRKLLAREILRR